MPHGGQIWSFQGKRRGLRLKADPAIRHSGPWSRAEGREGHRAYTPHVEGRPRNTTFRPVKPGWREGHRAYTPPATLSSSQPPCRPQSCFKALTVSFVISYFLPQCLQFVSWLAWMCDESAWHHKLFLVHLHGHLTIKLFLICLKVAKTRVWALPFYVSQSMFLTSWARPVCGTYI